MIRRYDRRNESSNDRARVAAELSEEARLLTETTLPLDTPPAEPPAADPSASDHPIGTQVRESFTAPDWHFRCAYRASNPGGSR